MDWKLQTDIKEEAQLCKTKSFFPLFHRGSSSHAALLSPCLYVSTTCQCFVVQAFEELPYLSILGENLNRNTAKSYTALGLQFALLHWIGRYILQISAFSQNVEKCRPQKFGYQKILPNKHFNCKWDPSNIATEK